MNSIKGWREGKSIIKFQDGTLMTYTTPDMRINGVIMGDMTINFSGSLTIKDYKYKIESITEFPYKDAGKIESIKNSIGKLFWSKDDSPVLDELSINISQVGKDKTKEVKSSGYGSWLGQIYLDGKKYLFFMFRFWSYDDDYLEWSQGDVGYILPSDSFKRNDLQSIKSDEFDIAQKYKDELENTQRKDRKLREENKK